MATVTKSIFLYGKPTAFKWKLLVTTQMEYRNLVNRFIERMAFDRSFLLDLLNNNKQATKVRELEKELRRTHELGSAYGQNAVDMAVKELHNHIIRIRNSVYGYVLNNHPEMKSYVSFKSLLNASVLNEDELTVIGNILQYELKKEKSDESKTQEFKELLFEISNLSIETRNRYKETIADLFLEKLECSCLPYVKKLPLQLDTRLSTIEESHSIKEHFVVFVKLLGSKERVAFPVSTSQNSLRRMKQYKTGSMTISTTKNGNIKIGVPFSKKIKKEKPVSRPILAMDAGITDLIATNTGSTYGTFVGMGKLYSEVVEPKLGERSSLRSVKREYQKRLIKSDNPYEQEWLQTKIQNISRSLKGKKKVEKKIRHYAHESDTRINVASDGFVQEAIKSQAFCVYEDLDITEFDRGKKNNKRDSMWVRGKLIQKIQSKLDWLGIPHAAVDPAYTSKTCANCSNIDDKNRNGKSFICTACKHEDDADHNAAINIEKRAFDHELKVVVGQYFYNTKKRHEAIKALFAERHCSYLNQTPGA